MNEFKRLGDKIASETANLHSRIETLEKRNNLDQFKQLLDKKLDKLEFTNFASLLQEETISPMQKEIDKSKKDI